MKKEIGLRNREKLNDFLCGFFSNDGFGFKLYNLTEKFKHLVSFYKTDFAILDANNKVFLESENGLFSKDHELMNNLNFSIDSLHQEMVSCLSLFKQKGSFIILRNAP